MYLNTQSKEEGTTPTFEDIVNLPTTTHLDSFSEVTLNGVHNFLMPYQLFYLPDIRKKHLGKFNIKIFIR